MQKPQITKILSENLCLNVCFLSILWAFCALNGHEQKPPFYDRLPFIHRGCLNLFYVVKYEAPEFLSKLRESEKVETMGRTARRRQGVFFGRLGVPERSGAGAAGSGRCAVGVFFGEGAAGRCTGPAGGRDAAPSADGGAAAGCVFQWGAARSTAGAAWAAEGSGGEVNAVGTAVRALVEAPVGFEKALEGIGCGEGEVGRGGGVRGEHVGGGAGGVGRRESRGGGRRALWPRVRGGSGLRGAAARAPRAGCGG